MANRDPEPESAHQQFSEAALEVLKQKAKEELEKPITPPPFEKVEGGKSGKK